MTCVLAADDSTSMRLMIAHTLRAAGCEVIVAVVVGSIKRVTELMGRSARPASSRVPVWPRWTKR